MDVDLTQHSNIRWQHCDEINAEFDIRIEERPLKDAVEKPMRLMLVALGLVGLVTL
jgi:hypothetical protein